MAEIIFLGSFEVTSGKVRVCDPCYSREVKGVLVLENVLPGRYYARVEIRDTGIWGKRVAGLSIWHKSYAGGTDILLDEGVGVDSGQAGFFDDEYYSQGESTGDYDNTETFYGKACACTLSDDKGGVIDNFGVVSASGYGDGVYDVHIIKNTSGQIVGAAIDYGLNNDEEEDYEEV